jgi:hypothetical protein
MEVISEKYRPKIVYIKGIHNTVADAISRLEYDSNINPTPESYYMTKVKSSKRSQRQNWMAISNHWRNLDVDITPTNIKT